MFVKFLPSWFRKSLLFLCLSVASAVALPVQAQELSTTTIAVFDSPNWEISVASPENAILLGVASTSTIFSGGCQGYVGDYPATTTDFAGCSYPIPVSLNSIEGNSVQDAVDEGVGVQWWFGVRNATNGESFYACFENGTSSPARVDCPLSYSSSTIDFGFSSGFQSVQNTRFTALDFSGTSTVNIDVEYFLDQSEVDTSISERNPSLVRFQYSLRPSTTLSGQSESIDATASGTASVDTNLSSLADGTYDLLISFSNLGVAFGSAQPFAGSYIYTDFTIAGGVLSSTGTVEYYDATTFLDESQPRECGLTDLGGCIINAFTFLFIPSTASLNNFSTLNNTISSKFPFAYAYDFSDSIETLYTSGATESLEVTVPFGSFGNITLLSATLVSDVPFASLIKTILGYLLWVMFAVQMYRRTLTIFNTNPA